MFQAYLLSVRPKTLVAAVVPIVTAAALAYATQQHVSYSLLISAISCALCLQIATNLFNDLIDFKKGADDHRRVGPTRVTQSGMMAPESVLALAVVVSLGAVLFGIPLVIQGGWPFFLLGLCSLFLAYGYTGGPFPLAYLGIGDIFVILFFGFVAVCGSYYLFTLQVSLASLVLALQVGFLATVLLAINNLRDSDTDKEFGKKTLAVRFGDSFAKKQIALLIGTTFVLTFFWMLQFKSLSFLLVFLSVPLALRILKIIFNYKNKAELNQALGLAGALMLLFAFLMCLALLI